MVFETVHLHRVFMHQISLHLAYHWISRVDKEDVCASHYNQIGFSVGIQLQYDRVDRVHEAESCIIRPGKFILVTSTDSTKLSHLSLWCGLAEKDS